MTPTELETYVRQRMNSTSDTFWSSSELQTLMYDAQMIMAREALVIERVYTTTTIAGTREYAFPTNTMAIKRITYNGQKLQKISLKDDDQLTGLLETDTVQSTPQFYAVWNYTLYLRPVPDNALTLKIYSFNEPQPISGSNATLEVPTQFHLDMADYIVGQMLAKEKNYSASQFWMNSWNQKLLRIRSWARKRTQTDSLNHVQDIDSSNESFLGTI